LYTAKAVLIGKFITMVGTLKKIRTIANK
jgi:hypothetical protein